LDILKRLTSGLCPRSYTLMPRLTPAGPLFALLAIAACNTFRRSSGDDASAPSGEPRYRNVEIGREIVPTYPIDASAAVGAWAL
jgi:hypothetical protein